MMNVVRDRFESMNEDSFHSWNGRQFLTELTDIRDKLYSLSQNYKDEYKEEYDWLVNRFRMIDNIYKQKYIIVPGSLSIN